MVPEEESDSPGEEKEDAQPEDAALVEQRLNEQHLQDAFFIEVQIRCEFACRAAHLLNHAVNSHDTLGIFTAAQSIVSNAAAISRIFWPPTNLKDRRANERARDRGERLRNSLALPEDHPVKSRALRNHFEHYDERLDDWADKSIHRNLVTYHVGPRGSVGGGGITAGDILHLYDPGTKQYFFRGDTFDLQEMVSGVVDIRRRLIATFPDLMRRLGVFEE